ncbi:hypothetical protein CEUSTIGMA_g5841.t1 [Chlamydomonas eustigma]|uniref:Uncharacterized protein n=1 Tax=Chlamydomonas eustigma TaxID=1157962 RepID=A0A250X638_9CHLO|nr:hypothetical protein CEUSTIGMA_g5841.t1 [Chlamydomonas eustigma]|eukprot:GAX78399.1 hypothetical protein CEUSTIGMA_g5841.t1 [Chlamydomonas eustigma]
MKDPKKEGKAAKVLRQSNHETIRHERDPERLIHEFDKKLNSIHTVLQRMEDAAKSRPTSADILQGRIAPSNSKERAGKAMMDPSRMKSAGPRLTRALAQKLHVVRNNPKARDELSARAHEHLQARAQESAAARAADPHANFNFVDANRNVLTHRGAERLLRTATLHGFSPNRIMWHDEDEDEVLDIGPLKAAAASDEEMGPDHTFLTQVPSMFKRGSTAPIAIMARSSLASSTVPSSPFPPFPPTASKRSAFAIASTVASGDTRDNSPLPGTGGGGSTAALPRMGTSHSTTHGALRSAWGAAGGSPALSLIRGASLSAAASLQLQLPEHRALRTMITSRPATGGSPSTREPFLSERRYLEASRVEHAAEVAERRAIVTAEAAERRNLEATKRDRKMEELMISQEERTREEELMERRRVWAGICNLGFKMKFLVKVLNGDRGVRPLREMRKECAVRIASWYKHILIKRRTRELLQLINKMRRAMARYLPHLKEHVREVAGLRIIEFMRAKEENSTAMATAAVSKFIERVYRLQDWWQVMSEVRAAQHKVLYNQVTKYEKALVRHNLRVLQGTASGPYKPTAHIPAAGGITKTRQSFKERDTQSRGGRSPSGSRSPNRLASRRPEGSSQVTTASSLQRRSSLSGASASAGSGMLLPSVENLQQLQRNLQPHVTHHRTTVEIEDPFVNMKLAKHYEPLAKAVRQRMVHETLQEERRAFGKRVEKYRTDMTVFHVQMKIEMMRVKLIQEAGLEAQPRLKKPVKPYMCVLLPPTKIKALLAQGLDYVREKQERETESKRIEDEIQAELEVAAHGGGTGGSPTGGLNAQKSSYHLSAQKSTRTIHGTSPQNKGPQSPLLGRQKSAYRLK